MDKELWQNKGAGHRQRLRQRFTECGLDGFTDAEVLELLLSFGTPRKDCKTQACELLDKFGSFAAVLDAEIYDIRKIKGIGPKNSFALIFVKSVADRYLKQRLQNKSYLKSSSDVIDFLTHSMRGLKIEVFSVIYLDASHGIIDSEIIAEGTVNVNTIYPREIIRQSIRRNASALVVAHNHPSGSITPSPQDIKLTKTLYLVCSLVQIRLLDHVVIGDGHFSFADNGLMAETEEWSRQTVCNVADCA